MEIASEAKCLTSTPPDRGCSAPEENVGLAREVKEKWFSLSTPRGVPMGTLNRSQDAMSFWKRALIAHYALCAIIRIYAQ